MGSLEDQCRAWMLRSGERGKQMKTLQTNIGRMSGREAGRLVCLLEHNCQEGARLASAYLVLKAEGNAPAAQIDKLGTGVRMMATEILTIRQALDALFGIRGDDQQKEEPPPSGDPDGDSQVPRPRIPPDLEEGVALLEPIAAE